ncbi:MAG: hypothetical protein F7C38_01080 [Desulfurococcales archaeon]|nr:hypothetical protein [Desulfurococcales archaeon]
MLVVVSWVWLLVGAYAVGVVVYYLVEGSPPTGPGQLFGLFYEKPYLASYIELAAVGGLQLAVSLACGDDFRVYGVRRGGLWLGLALSLVLAVALFSVRVVWDGWNANGGFGLSFPLNVFYALLGTAVYGPLEVFFVVWLIVNTDRALGWRDPLAWPGSDGRPLRAPTPCIIAWGRVA